MERQVVPTDFSKKLAQIISRAWADETFKERLLRDPASVAEEYGAPLPPGKELRVVEDTAKIVHFVLPAPPSNMDEISERELEQVAGGVVADAQKQQMERWKIMNDAAPTSTSGGSSVTLVSW